MEAPGQTKDSAPVSDGSQADPVLAVEDLTMYYATRSGDVQAVDGVSFAVGRGESVGLVGESGCGKSSIAMTLLKLLPENARIVGGRILLNGTDLAPLSENEIRRIAGTASRWCSRLR